MRCVITKFLETKKIRVDSFWGEFFFAPAERELFFLLVGSFDDCVFLLLIFLGGYDV